MSTAPTPHHIRPDGSVRDVFKNRGPFLQVDYNALEMKVLAQYAEADARATLALFEIVEAGFSEEQQYHFAAREKQRWNEYWARANQMNDPVRSLDPKRFRHLAKTIPFGV